MHADGPRIMAAPGAPEGVRGLGPYRLGSSPASLASSFGASSAMAWATERRTLALGAVVLVLPVLAAALGLPALAAALGLPALAAASASLALAFSALAARWACSWALLSCPARPAAASAR